MPGTTSPTTRRDRGPIAGARTAWPASPTTSSALLRAGPVERQDPILKERLFGLTNSEGNHGEDVKEYYFYLDSTPTHSYMKYLYKYPQAAYPYDDCRRTGKRGRGELEYELIDTGVFDETATSTCSWSTPRRRPRTSWSRSRSQPRARGGRAARAAHPVVPNQWSWGARPRAGDAADGPCGAASVVAAVDETWAPYLYCDGGPAAVHGERDQHAAPLRRPNRQPVRQGRHQRLHRPRRTGR
jgi:hypothetical protein